MSISCVNQSHETNFRMVILKVLALGVVDGFGAIVVPGRHGFVRFVMRGSEKVRFAQAFLLDTLLKSVCTTSLQHLLTNRFCHVLFSSFFRPSGRYPGLWRLRRQRLPSQEISWSLEKGFWSKILVLVLCEVVVQTKLRRQNFGLALGAVDGFGCGATWVGMGS